MARVRASRAAALARLDAAVTHWSREQVLYLIWRKPWMSVARDTYVSATLARAGLDTLPVESSRRYPEIGDHDLAWQRADRILLSTEPYAFRPRDATALAQATGKPVTLIDGEWTSWYGVRAIDGLRGLAGLRQSK
ncbi:MAG: helical backbone metal receptor [Casimicrobiaceae bacterium]